jgi:hypothetical protein
VLLGPEQATPASVPAKEGKLRIPGVHSRVPALIVALVVAISGAFYAADRTGRLRLRNLTDGWLTPVALAAGPASVARERFYDPLPPFSRGILTVDRAREADGAPALPAAPELELPGVPGAQPVVEAPMSDEERERRQARYREYLESQGLTRLGDAVP